MAVCDPNALLAEAACFNCLTDYQLQLIQAQLLCNISDATGASSLLPQLAGPVSGWPPPPDITLSWARWNSTDGIIYVWNTDTQAWEPSA